MPSPGDLPNPNVKPRSPALQADSLPDEPPENPRFSIVSQNSLADICHYLTEHTPPCSETPSPVEGRRHPDTLHKLFTDG